MDASIILAGQPVDLVRAMRQGNAAAIETNALRQNNQLTDLYRQQGAGLLAGDQGAMNALAGVDPGLAMGMKADQQTYAQNTRKMEILDANERRAIEDRAASMTAAERAAAAAELESNVAMGMAIPDEATWDATMAQVAPDLVGQFGNRQALAMKYMSVAEAFKIANPEPTKPQSTLGKFYADQGAGLLPADAVPPSGDGVTVNLGGGSDKQVFDAMMADRDLARSAASGYNSIKEAKAAVDSGIISGFGADNILALQKLGAALGIADPGVIQNTETFRSAIAPQIAAVLKSVAGTANLSNSDREFAEKAAGGNINLDDGTIKRLLGIMEKASRASIEGYQTRLNSVYPDSPQYQRERAILGISVPEFLPPGGVVDAPPAPGPAAPATSIPSGAVDLLLQNNTEEYRKFFDEVFGPGAAAQALGGN